MTSVRIYHSESILSWRLVSSVLWCDLIEVNQIIWQLVAQMGFAFGLGTGSRWTPNLLEDKLLLSSGLIFLIYIHLHTWTKRKLCVLKREWVLVPHSALTTMILELTWNENLPYFLACYRLYWEWFIRAYFIYLFFLNFDLIIFNQIFITENYMLDTVYFIF